jgi:hypothetical protein
MSAYSNWGPSPWSLLEGEEADIYVASQPEADHKKFTTN